MRTILITFTLLLLLATPPAVAQEGPSDEIFVTQIEPLVNPEARLSADEALDLIYTRLWTEHDRNALDAYRSRGVGGSFALVSQAGTGNVADVLQAGPANLAVLYQQGNGNASLLGQIGAGNLYGSYLTGSGNATSVVQRGCNNIYVLDFKGDGLQHTAVQAGANNQAVQVGAGTVPFDIEQRGDNMQMIIRHSP